MRTIRDTSRTVRLWLYALGAALTMVVAAMSRVDVRTDTVRFLIAAAVASAIYAGAVVLVFRASPSTRKGLWLCLAAAVLCRVPLLLAEPTLSDDIYRYIWDGRVQSFGFNPYVSAPGDPALQHVHTPVTLQTSYPALPTIYPPAAQWFFRAVGSVDGSVGALKLAFVLCDLLLILLLLRWLALTGHSAWRVLVYAWNPLVLLEVAGSGHLDVLGAMLLFLSFLALSQRITWLAALSFVLAVEVKFLPVVLAPLLWRRIRARDAVVAAGVALAVGAPFLIGVTGAPVGSLPVYLQKWRFNGPAFAAIEYVVAGRWVTLVPAIVGVTVAMCVRTHASSPWAWAWAMGAALLLMPALYPWYLLWLVPFLCVVETAPLLVWTQSVLLTYVVWHGFTGAAEWQVPWWAQVAEFGSVGAAAAWVVVRALTRRGARPATALGGS